jgi:hypothetical protein
MASVGVEFRNESLLDTSLQRCLQTDLFSDYSVTILVTIHWVWTGNRINCKLVITSKSYALTVLYTSQITIGYTRSCQNVTVYLAVVW